MHFMHAWNWTCVTFSEGFGHWTFLWRVHPIAQHAEEQRWNSQHPTRNETDSRLFQNRIIISTPRFNFNQDAVASLFAAHGTASVTRSTWVTCEAYPQKHGPKWLRFDAWPIFLNPWRFRSHAAHTSAPAKNASAGHCQSGSVASEGARWIPVNSDQLESWHLQGKSIARGTQKWMVSLQNPIEKWRILGKSSPYFRKPQVNIYILYIIYIIIYIYTLYIIYIWQLQGSFFGWWTLLMIPCTTQW